MGKLVDTAASGTSTVGTVSGGGLSLDDPMVMAGVAAVVVIGGIAAAVVSSTTTGGGNDSSTEKQTEPEPEPVDVSIPYDAAAVLSYKTLKGPTFSKKEYDQIVTMSDFQSFSKEYKDIAVEEITLKVEMKKLEEKKLQFEQKKTQFLEAYSTTK